MTGDATRPGEPLRGPPRELKIALTVLAVIVGLLAGARILLVTPPGRALVTAIADGRSLGRFGRLGVQGLHGDILSTFTVDRVTVSDAKGVWLVGRKVQVRWYPLRPVPPHPPRRARQRGDGRRAPPPRDPALRRSCRTDALSLEIGRFTSQLELMPALAKQYGRWAVAGGLDLTRSGPCAARSTPAA